MNIAFIKELIALAEEMDVEEIEVRRFGTSVRIRKNSKGLREVTRITEKPIKEFVEDKLPEKKIEREEHIAIKAPMVGTFYRAPAPDAPPYVEIGDRVTEGQIVCLVEAMKIMNEIESDVRGTIVDILVKNEDPVEFNQELFLVKPE
ncbi:acetyl-CoA carboxylase biotin carboxyl carrier protein [candidate division WOR-3 bacterium]|nr:acetyl-CoA carboxylase biotin carboxyl carrier protein [candidate division WOR-3 bacterium]